MKRSLGKTENTDEGLNQQSPDGIVGEKTRDELDKWLSKDWIKPIPTLRHGEYDDTGVQNGKGKKGTDDHHQGTPVVEAQQNLQKVEASTDAAIDGWFYDKMLDAVKLFQDAAEKGEFIMNGVLTVIGENLTGHQKGEVDAKTQEYLKKVVDKTGTVPKPERPKWLEIAEQEAKRWAGKTEKEISKSFNYHKEVGISLSDLVGTDHAWCASFVNYCLKKANYAAFSPACRAKAIATDENFVKVEKPFTGCIALIGTHHVGFAYAVHTTKKVPILLGGNQSDQINFTAFSESITYFLPKDFKKPDKIPDLSLATTTELNAKFGIALNIKGGDVTR